MVAIALAALGMGLALHQIRLVTRFLEAQAQHRAAQIANDARIQFDRQRTIVLQAVAEKIRSRSDTPWRRPAGWLGWVDGLFTWDGADFVTLIPPEDAPEGFVQWAAGQLRAREESPPGLDQELLYGTVGEGPVAIACGRHPDADGRPILIAVRVHLDRLRTTLIEPLISPSDGLEIVGREEVCRPWSQSMFGITQSWAIQPTAAFLSEQRATVIWQTVAHLSLTLLALATLLVAIWYLIRLARREVALAEMKSNFVADVSHELKTPLATIQLFAETLQSGRVTSEQKREEYCTTITRETTRLTNLIENILDFARIDAGRKAYSLEPADIRQVIRETYEMFVPQLDHHQFEHHLHMDDDLPPVDIDRTGISQVLLNLLSNALKYSGDERYLAVEVTSDTQRGCRGVLISVHDHGIGIRPEDRAHLFDGFFRAADQRVRERGGTGLGLALVKHIVDAHHGSLHVESRLVKGTTFRVFLPISENVEASISQNGSP